jgi:hypothetical protein
VTTNIPGPDVDIRQCADHAVTVPTNSPTPIVKQRESIVVRFSDDQQPTCFLASAPTWRSCGPGCAPGRSPECARAVAGKCRPRQITELIGAPYISAVADALGWTQQDVTDFLRDPQAHAA